MGCKRSHVQVVSPRFIKTFLKLELLEAHTKISPRRGKNESIAAELIKEFLIKAGLQFLTQTFQASIPKFTKAILNADGKDISCLGTSFVSGEITLNVSIQEPYEKTGAKEMIIYNPISKGICAQSLKEVPALAVSVSDVELLKNSKEITGIVEVEEEEFQSQNILVGNADNPRKIVFAHYDSIVGSGALDNAAAVDVVYETILADRALLDNNLFVFAGCEEESFSNHDGYYGFEMFDKEYGSLLDLADEIIVIDGIGVSDPYWTNQNIDWVFGIPRLNQILSKVISMENDQSIVRQYYHSALDTLEILSPEFIAKAKDLLLKRLR